MRVVEQDRAHLRAVGVVTPPRLVSPRRAPRSRVVGTALDDNGNPVWSDSGRSTVKVTRDGITSYEPAASFRRTSTTAHARVTHTRRPVNYALEHRTVAADLRPIQNYEED